MVPASATRVTPCSNVFQNPCLSQGDATCATLTPSDERPSQISDARYDLAGIVHTAAFAEREFGTLNPGVDRMWDKPGCVLSTAYMDAMRQVGDVLDAAKRVRVPWLLVHGTADDLVPVQDSRDAAGGVPHARLIQIEGADHLFTGEPTTEVVRTVADWIKRLGS